MPGYDLEILRQHRGEILKAELGAFLHNIGKFGREFIFSQLARAGNTDANIVRYKDTFEYRNIVGIKYRLHPSRYQQKQETVSFLDVTTRTWLENTNIQLPGPFNDRADYCLGDFIEYQEHDFYRLPGDTKRKAGRWTSTSNLTELLEISHDASAVDKEIGGGGVKQANVPVYLATVFGHERILDLDGFDSARDQFLQSIQRMNQASLLPSARQLMTLALGDTQWPLNDITLRDVSSAVAAFFKAALAKMLLEGKWTDRADLKWRILRFALDGPAFYDRVSRLPDLIARKQIIGHGLDEVRKLLGDTCPIANEVYRDEFGSAFVVPDLEGDDPSGNLVLDLLRDQIIGAFRAPYPVTDGEQRQHIRSEASRYLKLEISPRLSVGSPHERALGLADELARSAPGVTARPQDVQRWWHGVERADVCTVCGVRPQGYGPDGTTSKKAKQRHVCVPCEVMRDDRCEKWLTDALGRTIWLDEVADANGRIALLVGRFGIDRWLNPNGYVERSLIANPNTTNPAQRFKKLTFARLRRVWETTACFWKDVQNGMNDVIPAVGVRWRLRFEPSADSREAPVFTHAYQLDIPDVGRLAVACSDSQCGFITAENLERLAKRHETTVDVLRQRIQGRDCKIYEDRYDDEAGWTKLTEITRGKILEAREDSDHYRGTIPILADPRSFMMLIPASAAACAVEAIKRRYDTEMVRVRNRLAIKLGLVFAEAHSPLHAVLDAGRRMMGMETQEEPWTLSEAVRAGNGWSLNFENGVTWQIPGVMADGSTADEWYPYFSFASSDKVVHVKDLQKGDHIKVTPSRFDFQFLDNAATRFELHYGHAVKDRRFPRPYLLEQWDDLSRVWELLSARLARSQIKALQADIGAKRRQWREASQMTFGAFVKDTLARSSWSPPLCAAELEFLTFAGVAGWLEDAIELYMGILKQKPRKEREPEEGG